MCKVYTLPAMLVLQPQKKKFLHVSSEQRDHGNNELRWGEPLRVYEPTSSRLVVWKDLRYPGIFPSKS